jgi:hypothetical protein
VFANAGIKTVTNGVVPASNAVIFNQTGTFYWRAVYSGDGGNSAVSSVCADETVTVVPHTITLAFNSGFTPKLAPFPKKSPYKSPGVEMQVSFTDTLRDGSRVDVTTRARNVPNNCVKPLPPSAETLRQFSVPVVQGGADTIQLAFKLFEVTTKAIKTVKKAKCTSLTLEIIDFSATGFDKFGAQSNSVAGSFNLEITIPDLVLVTSPVQLGPASAASELQRAVVAAPAEGERAPPPK